MPLPSRSGSRPLDFRPRFGRIVGAFCAIKNWHPAVAKCEESKEGDTTFRTLTLKDGGKIKEKLTGTEDVAYTYDIVESPLPVKNYKSKLWLELDDEPDRTVIFWQSDFDANGASDEEAKKIVTGILGDGVKGIKKVAITAWDAKHPDEAASDDDDDDAIRNSPSFQIEAKGRAALRATRPFHIFSSPAMTPLLGGGLVARRVLNLHRT